ncbi:hypothetical protein [Pedobacter sp. BMA]|uniref:DUF3999 family protein n=1 Tax=Pedobacter sp. BMA TaxID=1663685 RepID=UPI0018CF96F2|nr:hypothetical protein [Pedobacter sp. BMA]
MKINSFLLLMLLFTITKAQTNKFKFRRNITGVNANWHKLKLPERLYKNVGLGFDDLRIFGINGKDTLEVPYLLKQKDDLISSQDVPFKQINQSTNTEGYFYTFHSPQANTINQITLNFKDQNFDWHVKLEGSNDNKEWFTILNNYRILSIKNSSTDYHFTKLDFADSKYQYYRIALKSQVQPELLSAKISKSDTIKGTSQEVKYKKFNIQNDAVQKVTIIDIPLENTVPVSFLKLKAMNSFDFYRPLKIECVTDSFKTDNGIRYNYAELYQGTFSSFEKPEYHFLNTITSGLRITIQNNDNQPLRLGDLELKGNIYEIIARFDNPALSYSLYYGNEKSTPPSYEIEKFQSKIPPDLTSAIIGDEEKNPAYSVNTTKPLFENKAWLWIVMAIIIALLGWFSFRMLKN